MADEEHKIAYNILAYLDNQKDSQDTLEGIVRWWLLQQTIEEHLPRVKKALAVLVKQKLILEREGKGTWTHYKINPDRREEISQLLKEGSNP